jgi:hypothetical protein
MMQGFFVFKGRLGMKSKSELEKSILGIDKVSHARVSSNQISLFRKNWHTLSVSGEGYDPNKICNTLRKKGYEIDLNESWVTVDEGVEYVS